MNKNQEYYVAIVIPVIKVKLYKDKYVENIKGGKNACVFIGDREQKRCENGGSSKRTINQWMFCMHLQYPSYSFSSINFGIYDHTYGDS
jgi:hypothetical protein